MHRPDASKLIKQYKQVLQKISDEGQECLTIGERESLRQLSISPKAYQKVFRFKNPCQGLYYFLRRKSQRFSAFFH